MAGYLADLRQVVDTMTAPDQPYVFIGHSWGAMYLTWFINEYGDDGGRLRGAILSDPGAFTKAQLDAFIKRYMGTVSLTGEQFNDALWAGQFMSAEDHARADYLRMLMAIRGIPAEHNDPAHPTPRWREGAVVNAALVKLADHNGFDFTTHLQSFRHKVLFLRSELTPPRRSNSSRSCLQLPQRRRHHHSRRRARAGLERPDGVPRANARLLPGHRVHGVSR